MAENGDDQQQTREQPKKQERGDPVYTVVRVTDPNGKPRAITHAADLKAGDRLEVVAVAEEAKTQEKACDAFMESLPADQRNGALGAFLRNSYRTFEYETEQRTVIETRKKGAQQPTLTEAVAAGGGAGSSAAT
jgi:hypothetical protein